MSFSRHGQHDRFPLESRVLALSPCGIRLDLARVSTRARGDSSGCLYARRPMTMSSGGEEGKTERKKGRPLITIEKSEIMALLDRPQPLAAQSLGISLSVFKKACRKHGIERWPYQRRWTGKADRLNAPPSRSSSSQQPTTG